MLRTIKGAALIEYAILAGAAAMIGGGVALSIGAKGSDPFEQVAQVFGASKRAGEGDVTHSGDAFPKEGSTSIFDDEQSGIDQDSSNGSYFLPHGFAPPTLNLNSGFISYADTGIGDDLVDVNFADYMVQSEHWLADDITRPVDLTLQGHPSARMIINGGPEVESGTIHPRKSLIVRMKPPAAYSATREVTVMAGSQPFAYFRISTRPAPDLTPDQFDIQDIDEAEPGSLVVFKPEIITGIEVNRGPSEAGVGLYEVPVTVSGQGNPEIRAGNSGEWGTKAVLHNRQSLHLRMIADDTGGTRRQATVSVNNVHDTFSATTREVGAKLFSFINQQGDLGTHSLSETGRVVTSISVDASNVGGFALDGQPSEFSDTSLRLSATNSGVDIICDWAPGCAGSFTFDVSVRSWNPAENAHGTYSILIEP